MEPAPKIWLEALTIHSYDVDFRRQLTLEALCRYFLEAAWNHAEALGFGFSHLAKDHKVWVLSRLLLAIERYPRWGDAIKLETWPRGTESVFALRDFELLEDAGARMAGGSAAWLILDTQSRRPQRVEKYLTPITPVVRRATDRDPCKVVALGLRAESGLEEYSGTQAREPLRTEVRAPVSWPVRYSDVDLNGHVNSARYIGWLMDSYGAEWHQQHAPGRLEINYLAETHQGETLSLMTEQISPLEFRHGIFKADRQEACRAVIDWNDIRRADFSALKTTD